MLAKTIKNLPAMWETWLSSLGREDPLEKGKRKTNMVWYHLFVELQEKIKSQSHRKRIRLWLPRVEGRRNGEVYFKGYILSVIN